MKSPLISPLKLATSLHGGACVVFDVRPGTAGYDAFLKTRISGARYADLEKDLSQVPVDPRNGGRHPLPVFEDFIRFLEKSGVSNPDMIVLYDDKMGANAAARLWWMLRAAGHDRSFVLDGGFEAAKLAGVPLDSGEPADPVAKKYTPPVQNWSLPTVSLQEVDKARKGKDSVIIDVRDAYRYQGISEPIDRIAGHIPGAENLPFSQNLTREGRFKSPEQLRRMFEQVLGESGAGNVIVHCGSGVTACHTILAFEHAGLEIPALYVGSWSEWSNAGMPVAR